MTLVAVIVGAVAVAGIVGVPLYLMARESARRSKSLTDTLLTRMQARFENTLPLKPFVPLPLDKLTPDEADLRVTIRWHPESDGERLPKVAAEVIREVSRLEEAYGGKGLEYDPAGSIEEADRLVLRLVPRSADWYAPDRLAAVADELNRLVRRAHVEAAAEQQSDIRARIERELQPHLPPEMIGSVERAIVS